MAEKASGTLPVAVSVASTFCRVWGLARDQWGQQMARAGVMTGNVLGAYANRRTLAGTGRMASDKSGLFEDGI